MQNIDSGYIFLSHSHTDILTVRKIRNYLEDIGGNPIMLYLRGTDRPSAIRRIIRHEIKARENFIYCDSPAARKSKWVSEERRYVDKLKDKPRIVTVDLSSDFEREIIPKLKLFKIFTTIFVSYSRIDSVVANTIISVLKKHDYNVLSDFDVQPGTGFATIISDMIVKAAHEGCIVNVVTANSINNSYIHLEVDVGLSADGLVLPLVLGDVDLSEMPHYSHLINRFPVLHMHSTPTKRELEDFASSLYDIIYTIAKGL